MTSRDVPDSASLLRRRSWFLLTAILLGIAFLPTLTADFVPQDQWRAFRYSFPEGSAAYRARECAELIPSFYVFTGRPLVWLGECGEHAWVGRIQDFRALRPLALLALLLSAFVLAWVLEPIFGSLPVSLIVGASAVLSPGYTFMYLQGLTGAPVLLSLGMGAASYGFFLRADRSRSDRTLGGFFLPAATSLALFLAGCCIYPSFAFVWTPISALYLGFDPSLSLEDRVARFGRSIICYGIASALYLLMIKVMISLWVTQGMGPAQDLGQYNFSLAGSSSLLLSKLHRYAMHFWVAIPVAGVPWVPGWIKLVLLAAPATLVSRPGDAASPSPPLRRRLVAAAFYLAALGAALLVTISPWLFNDYLALGQRHSVTIEIMLLFSLAVMAKAWLAPPPGDRVADSTRFERVMLLALFIPLVAHEVSNSTSQVIQSSLELQPLRTTLRGLISSGEFWSLQQLHIVRPARGVNFAGISRFQTGEAFQPSIGAEPEHAFQMITAVLRELLPDSILHEVDIKDCREDQRCLRASARPGRLVLTHGRGPIPPLLTSSVVVDYNQLAGVPGEVPDEGVLRSARRRAVTRAWAAQGVARGFEIIAAPPAGDHPVVRAFDGSIEPDDFWETRMSPGPTVALEFAEPITVRSYELPRGEMVERVPVAWSLEGSLDGEAWTVLDTQELPASWPDTRGSRFPIPTPAPYPRYRVRFLRSADAALLRVYELTLRLD